MQGVLYYEYIPAKRHAITAGLKLVVPKTYQLGILRDFHDDPLGAHQGIQRTFDLISSHYYWPRLHSAVSSYVKGCVRCIVLKTPRIKRAGLMKAITATHPFDIVGVDILGPLPLTKRKYRYILVFTDYFTKFPICFALKDIRAITVAQKLIEVLLQYGPTTRIISDRGSQFMSEVFKAVMDVTCIQHAPSTSFHPQTNGLTERFNHTLCVMLSMYVHDNQGDWDLYLPYVQYAYSITPHTSTKYSPFELLYTYTPRPLNGLHSATIAPEILSQLNQTDFAALKYKIQTVHEDVRVHLKRASETQKGYYDLNRRDISFSIGDRVWFYWPARGINAPMEKLSLPWSGPYWIHAKIGPLNYKLIKPDGT